MAEEILKVAAAGASFRRTAGGVSVNTVLRRQERKTTFLLADSLRMFSNMKHVHWEAQTDTWRDTHGHTQWSGWHTKRRHYTHYCVTLGQYQMSNVFRLFPVSFVLILSPAAVITGVGHVVVPVRVLRTFKFKCFVNILPEGHFGICTTQSSQRTQMSH